jgi:8-oxo-dGTP diphosphatase
LSGISQGILIKDHQVLMVKQYVKRGDIVWNFPGGGIEEGETPEEACIREMKEETGFAVQVVKKLQEKGNKFTFLTVVTGGELNLDKEHPDNDDIIDVAWIDLDDLDKFDSVTRPIIDLMLLEEPE